MSKVLCWGGGAIGGTVAAFLARAGHTVTVVDISESHVSEIRAKGLRITGPVAEFVQPLDIRHPSELDGKWKTVLLSVKAQFTLEACKELLPHLGDNGYVVSLQNGLCEKIISDRVGQDRTIGALVGFAADMLEPGVVRFGARAKFSIGELDGKDTPRLCGLRDLLSDFEPDVEMSPDIYGDLWGKMGFIALLYGTTLGTSPIISLWSDRKLFPVWRALVSEITETAYAQSIRPRPIDGLEPDAFRTNAPSEAARKSLAATVDFMRHSPKSHSGMWRDIAIHKRRTEADTQLPPVIQLSKKHGVEAPTLRELYRIYRKVERQETPQNDALISDLLPAALVSPVNRQVGSSA